MFDWNCYKTYACYIGDNIESLEVELSDAAKRTAISRIYYSYYHKVIQLNEYYDIPEYSFSKDTHEETINKIKRYKTDVLSKTELRELCDLIIELKGYRHQADYTQSVNYPDKRMNYILNTLPNGIDVLLRKIS